MDMDELAIQREGYAQAIVSKDFLQALRAGPGSKVAVTYFEWSMSGDERIIIPWRVIDGPEIGGGRGRRDHEDTGSSRFEYLDFRCD